MAPSTPAPKSKKEGAIPASLKITRTTRSKANLKESSSSSSANVPVTPMAKKTGLAGMMAPMTTGKIGRGVSWKLSKEAKEDMQGGSARNPIPPLPSFPSSSVPFRPHLSSNASTNTISVSTTNATASTSTHTTAEGGVETMQAFLRIRPSPLQHELSEMQTVPYLETKGDNQVLMTPPADPSRPLSTRKAPQLYSFNHVFPPSTSQSAFFQSTTLPLVEQVLQGQCGLLFSYGVSNSGKTYSTQGDDADADKAGLIPRSIDVVFNSIEGLECERNVKPLRQAAVVFPAEEDEEILDPASLAKVGCGAGKDVTAVKVDRNYSYAVFVSYAEVYNDKIFDLLENVPTGSKHSGLPGSPVKGGNGLPHSSSTLNRPKIASSGSRTFAHAIGLFGSRVSAASTANGGSGIIKRQALSLKNDEDGGKYVAGLKQIRVRSREEAQAVFKMGQVDRQVYGTCMNQSSSRSHGIFTIKVVRVHNGAPNDPDSATVSRLSIVDLAGSERLKNAQTKDEHLKETGFINQSLMTLGQCMETLRANQALAGDPTMAGKRKPALVPFVHSKLTQIFQSFFVGEGRAVMVVHVNPYDTGFDENSHVMRFSAIARQIQTTASNKVAHPFARGFGALKQAMQPKKLKVPVLGEDDQVVEEEFEVVVAEPEDDSDEEETDVLVASLFEENRSLRAQLAESEMRNVIQEADIRQEAVDQMNLQLQRMREMYERRLMEEIEASEKKADQKIDILHRSFTASAFNTPRRAKGGARTPVIAEDDSVDDVEERDVDERAIDASLIMDDSMSTEDSPTAKHHPSALRSLVQTGGPSERMEPVVEIPTQVDQSMAETSFAESFQDALEDSQVSEDPLRLAPVDTDAETSMRESEADSRDVGEGTSGDLEDDDMSEDEDSEDLNSDGDTDEDEDEEEEEEEEDDEPSFVAPSSSGVSSAASTPVKTPRRKSTAAPRRSTIAKKLVPMEGENEAEATSKVRRTPAKGRMPKTPLSVSKAQVQAESETDASDDEDVIPDKKAMAEATPEGTTYVPSPDEKDTAVKKKKRKLGKAVVQQDDMDKDSSKISGRIEVKRRVQV